MNGCSAQPIRSGGERSIVIALAASVGIHLVGGFASSKVGIDAESRAAVTDRMRWQDAGGMTIDFADQERPELTAEATLPAPDPAGTATDPPALLPEPPKPIELTLGIDGSKNKTDNMIGFREATEHSARLSEVDQPALDMNAGAAEEAVRAEGIPNAQPEAPATVVGPPAPPTPTLAEMAAEAIAAKKQPVGDAEQTRDEVTPTSTPIDTRIPETASGAAADKVIAHAPITDRTREFQPNSTQGAPKQEEAPPVSPALGANPATPAPPRPVGQPGEGGAAPTSNNASGDKPGSAPGIKSDKESDASSKTKPIEIRFGQTVAGDGVEIVTRKPRQPLFTKLTRVVAMPDNPGVEATFDASGKVVDVKLTKSSGFVEVDEPVMNMIYTWRARGPKLAELSGGDPKAKFSLKFLILIR